MKAFHWNKAHSAAGRARRGGVLLATFFTVAAALALGATTTAGAAGSFGPHSNVGSSPSGAPSSTGHADPSSTVAPLSQANIVVSDLSTGHANVFEYTNPAPVYPSNVNCNTGTTDLLCLNYGDGTGPNGGSFIAVPPAALAAGQSFLATMTVSAGGTTCGSGTFSGSAGASATGFVELDQYVFTPGPSPVKTVGVQFDCTNDSVDISGTIAFNIVPTDPGNGYYMFGQQGELAGFGNDNYLAYLDGAQYVDLNAPIVGMAPTHDGGGYWMVGSDGGVFTSGDAPFYGSTGGLHLNKPVVGMAATPDGKGYWFVASDGGIFSFGDAQFYGSTGGVHLNKPVVGMAATPDGGGYWLVASDGGIFSYGDAPFDGSTGSLQLNKPVVGMTATPDGKGYWFVASDGGVFTFGDAPFDGSLGGSGVADVAGMSLGL
jgi:hypothetical protein